MRVASQEVLGTYKAAGQGIRSPIERNTCQRIGVCTMGHPVITTTTITGWHASSATAGLTYYQRPSEDCLSDATVFDGQGAFGQSLSVETRRRQLEGQTANRPEGESHGLSVSSVRTAA